MNYNEMISSTETDVQMVRSKTTCYECHRQINYEQLVVKGVYPEPYNWWRGPEYCDKCESDGTAEESRRRRAKYTRTQTKGDGE